MMQREHEETQTHAAKVFIQQLHKAMDDLQSDQLVVLLLNCTAEIQAGIPEPMKTNTSTYNMKADPATI